MAGVARRVVLHDGATVGERVVRQAQLRRLGVVARLAEACWHDVTGARRQLMTAVLVTSRHRRWFAGSDGGCRRQLWSTYDGGAGSLALLAAAAGRGIAGLPAYFHTHINIFSIPGIPTQTHTHTYKYISFPIPTHCGTHHIRISKQGMALASLADCRVNAQIYIRLQAYI